MSKHTPGPWSLETVRTSSGLCHKIGPFPWKAGKENHACIYDDYPPHGSDGTPELAANARLIAASPEMLEALKVAKEELSRIALSSRDPDAVDCASRAHKACLTAIAKAEGQS